MINWLSVLFNLLWILGLALILAAFSYTDWLAHARGVRTRRLLGTATFQLPFSLGLALVSLSLFFLSQSWLERLVWAVFVLLFVGQAWSLKSALPSQTTSPDRSDQWEPEPSKEG